MRNAVVPRALAIQHGIAAKAVIVHPGIERLHAAAWLRSKGLADLVAKAPAPVFAELTYSRIIQIAAAASPDRIWQDLDAWVSRKLSLQSVNTKETAGK